MLIGKWRISMNIIKQDSFKDSTISFYGRKKGRLSVKLKSVLEELLPLYALPLSIFMALEPNRQSENDSYNSANKLTNNFYSCLKDYKNINLEIGFGSGDFIFSSATNYPQDFYLGVEVFANGVANLLDKLATSPLPNLKIYHENIHDLLDLFPNNIFDNIYILFPDPWHKKKHNKRRLINPLNLIKFSRILKPQGSLIFVSDHEAYAQWSLEHMQSSHNFRELGNKSIEFMKELEKIQTRYKQKALMLGKKIFYLQAINYKEEF
ncbi:tRNA (guanine-N(7)-)-methyltransferase [Candidatus Hepatincolaceae symbiont of Richtersius coronifer]